MKLHFSNLAHGSSMAEFTPWVKNFPWKGHSLGQSLHSPSPFIIITHPESWYSFHRPTGGRRL